MLLSCTWQTYTLLHFRRELGLRGSTESHTRTTRWKADKHPRVSCRASGHAEIARSGRIPRWIYRRTTGSNTDEGTYCSMLGRQHIHEMSGPVLYPQRGLPLQYVDGELLLPASAGTNVR